MIGGAVASGLVSILVAFEEEVSTAVAHINALAVEVGAFDRLAAAYGDTVVALGTLATVVPRDEEIVPAVVFEDERCLNGIGAGIIGGRIFRRIRIDR